jgi:hypothetical protein
VAQPRAADALEILRRRDRLEHDEAIAVEPLDRLG